MAVPFTLEEIDRAHEGATSKTVRQYLRTLHRLGIAFYMTHISDGHSQYFADDGEALSSAAVHDFYEISDQADRGAARRAIDAHARGETDYFAFCKQLAAAGIATWIMDPIAMTCTFCSRTGERLFSDSV